MQANTSVGKMQQNRVKMVPDLEEDLFSIFLQLGPKINTNRPPRLLGQPQGSNEQPRVCYLAVACIF